MDTFVAYPKPGNTGYTWTVASPISDAVISNAAYLRGKTVGELIAQP